MAADSTRLQIIDHQMNKIIKPLAIATARPLVERVLRHAMPPDTSRAEHDFDVLQGQTKPRDMSSYAYDDSAVWRRAMARCEELLALPEMSVRGRRVLEVGCGDGMVGTLLSTYGHEVLMVDMDDWRYASAKSTPFIKGFLEQGLPIEDDHFDLVYSYNTFEHVHDPAVCLLELQRVTKGGGLIYLHFGPLFNSAWGLHAYRTIHVPFPQFLFGEEFLQQKLRSIGIVDLGKQRDELQPLNRWSAASFNRLWDTCGCTIRARRERSSFRETRWILRYPDSFRGRDLDWGEVTTVGMIICLEKATTDPAPSESLPRQDRNR